MSDWYFAPLRATVAALVAHDSTRQIAVGVVLGAILGLLPKATLLAAIFAFALAAFRVNRAAGLASAGFFAMLTPWLDPLLHAVGFRVLAAPSLQSSFAWLYDLPLGPWMGFHNSVAMGSLLVGLYIAYPLYLAVRSLLDRVRPRLVSWVMKYRVARVLLGADVASRWGAL
ncbi:TIGR03546 family protein [Botrimarina hoheduenensis]|uniref:DUF2062 domain-containing protein n=1 Tax=Botrimarina hoheduenensis TaxID=2528000 RepID=A0A5C5WC74_9BACT|nr:TIGR03546 family protein [Botrimarina hoheduenensis]TWT47621.1 hypothetical protein Pla111_12370 [Botrimarina hoheduenensis]